MPTELADALADDSTLPRFAVPAELRRWGADARLAERSPRRATAMLLETIACFAAFIAFAEWVDRWWGWMIAWVGLVMCIMRADAIHHEAIHRSLFRRRWLNDVVAVVSGAVEGFHGPAYRSFHLSHHALTRRDHAPADPEGFYDETLTQPHRAGPVAISARTTLMAGVVIGGPVFVTQLLIDAVATFLGHPPEYVRAASLQRHVRRWGIAPFALWGAAIGFAVGTGHTMELLRWWVMPLGLFLIGPYTFFALPEHYDAGHNQPMITSTGSTRSNAMYRWIALDGNYHLAHHVFPTASWWRLPEADAKLEDMPLRHNGYVGFYRLLWRDLGARRRCPQ